MAGVLDYPSLGLIPENSIALLNNGVYDYATGRLLYDYSPELKFYGECRPETLVPGNMRYVCESDSRRLTEGEPMCSVAMAKVFRNY